MVASGVLTSGTRMRRLSGLGGVVAVLVALTWGSAPASATIIDRDTYTRPYDEVRWD